MKILPLQIDSAVTALLDYGLIAILLVIVGYFAWHLYRIQEENSKEWKSEAKESSKIVLELTNKQNNINEKQLDLQTQGNMQSKEFYDALNNKMDLLPEKIMKEMQYQKLVQAQQTNNTTSA